jgi:hypothetical protein
LPNNTKGVSKVKVKNAPPLSFPPPIRTFEGRLQRESSLQYMVIAKPEGLWKSSLCHSPAGGNPIWLTVVKKKIVLLSFFKG